MDATSCNGGKIKSPLYMQADNAGVCNQSSQCMIHNHMLFASCATFQFADSSYFGCRRQQEQTFVVPSCLVGGD